MEISDLILRLEGFRVRFKPSRESYIKFLFDFNSKVLEKCYPRDTLYSHRDELIVMVKSQVQQDIERAMRYYYNNNKFTDIWVPPSNKLDRLATEYISSYIKKLK